MKLHYTHEQQAMDYIRNLEQHSEQHCLKGKVQTHSLGFCSMGTVLQRPVVLRQSMTPYVDEDHMKHVAIMRKQGCKLMAQI